VLRASKVNVVYTCSEISGNIPTGFNQTAIVLRYSAHIKPRKTIKTIKTENITHKHNVTLIMLP